MLSSISIFYYCIISMLFYRRDRTRITDARISMGHFGNVAISVDSRVRQHAKTDCVDVDAAALCLSINNIRSFSGF